MRGQPDKRVLDDVALNAIRDVVPSTYELALLDHIDAMTEQCDDLRRQLSEQKKKTQWLQTYALELASTLDRMVASTAGQEDGEETQ